MIIAGNLNFNDYEFLCKVLDYVLQNQAEIEIVSGIAKGADKLGERYAKEKGYPINTSRLIGINSVSLLVIKEIKKWLNMLMN